ncbi:DUF6123 family protein [Ectobacillus sp. sgz5001026]|uniref:DUF6123 family protein n=1 Tax=Ectobacillus sp. sgz5001026 TaxID=3242473 RepID=UPI0036D324B5
MRTIEYIYFLHAKGFRLSKDALGFIEFGQKYTASSDELVIVAIETTLKHQRNFDGSYFIALLERLHQENISDVKQAHAFFRKLEG